MKTIWKILIVAEILVLIVFFFDYMRFEKEMIEKDKLENPYKYQKRAVTIDPYNLSSLNYNLANITIVYVGFGNASNNTNQS